MLEKFPHQDFDLNPIKLTHATMKIASDKLSTNAAATNSMLSHYRQGLLGLAVPPIIFNTITNIPFTKPVNLSALPIIPTDASTRAALVSQERLTKALSQLKEVEDSDQVLKNQLLQSFDEKYCKNLKMFAQVIPMSQLLPF